MFPAPSLEAAIAQVSFDVKGDADCLFDAEDSYSEWGLLTPPWSPCDSGEMDTCTECPLSDSACPTSSDNYLCSCMSCDCSGLEHTGGPVLRDCMWSQATGLPPPPSLTARQTSDSAASDTAAAADHQNSAADAADCRPCCPAITAACTNHTDLCVDPKNVFPCPTAGVVKTLCRPSSQIVASPDCSVTQSPVYDPDSETSAYCSSFSGLFPAAVCGVWHKIRPDQQPKLGWLPPRTNPRSDPGPCYLP